MPCVAYPRLTGPVEEGDEVIVNVQARELGLGSGGFDVLYVNLTRGLDLPAEPDAHVMKLPYTPLQHAVPHAEESKTLVRRDSAACRSSAARSTARSCRRAQGSARARASRTLQLPGGALPVSLSDAVRALKARGLVEAAVAVGACMDGDVHCVSTASALAWAKAAGFDVVVCAIGPGIVGTGSSLGHGGLAAAEAANAASALGGQPVVAVARVGGGRARTPPRAVAPHRRPCSRCVSARSRSPTRPTPKAGARTCDGLPLSHMGRGPDDDPAFFAAAYAAGRVARGMIPLMEERKLGPVVGLGTSGTFGGDSALAREVVYGGDRVGQPRSSTRRRCTARAEASLAVAFEGRRDEVSARDEDLGADARGGTRAVPATARVVRPRRRRADPQPRPLARAPRVDRGGARGRPHRHGRRHALEPRRAAGSRRCPAHAAGSSRCSCRTTRSSASAREELLPIAAEQGLAVIVMRPFADGGLLGESASAGGARAAASVRRRDVAAGAAQVGALRQARRRRDPRDIEAGAHA